MICPACHKKFQYTKLENANHKKGFACPLCGEKIVSRLSVIEEKMIAISTGIFVPVTLYASYKLTELILSPVTDSTELASLLFIFPFLVFVYFFMRMTQESISMQRYNEQSSNIIESKELPDSNFFSTPNLIMFAFSVAISLYFLIKQYLPKFF